MGNKSWNSVVYSSYAASIGGQSLKQTFKETTLKPAYNPVQITIREAVDSEANPESTPLIIGSDVTGSMGHLAHEILKGGLGVIMGSIYEKRPITNPAILCLAIGDMEVDQAPIQATQFESGAEEMTGQLQELFIEGGGGGNAGESYPAAWFFALHKTKCDAIDKRGKKGYIFTIGDEAPLPILRKGDLMRFFGVGAQVDLSAKEVLEEVEKNWNVFHLIVKPVSHQKVEDKWKELLGERAILIHDHTKMAETIVSVIQMNEGAEDHELVDQTVLDKYKPKHRFIVKKKAPVASV
jgi:hypothetical protein